MNRASRLILLAFCLSLGAPMVSGVVSADPTYYAIYCNNSRNNLSIRGGNHALLDCNGANPKVETKVQSLTTNPRGTYAVTIVKADCYPDAATSVIKDGRVVCSNGPPATLTLGKHFAASKKAAGKKKTKKKKSGSKSRSGVPSNIALSPVKPYNLPQSKANTNTVKSILQVVFGIIGAFALLMMTASGFKYITSAGDAGKTSEAKKGVLFALVGLTIAITAEAIVAFVIHRGAPGP